MAPKKRIAVIKNKAFSGKDNLTTNDWKAMVVDSATQSAELVDDWQGEPVVIPVVSLNEDNSRIENCTLASCGTLWGETGKVSQANKLWNLNEPVKLHLQPIPMEKFTFQGSMISEFVD